MTALLALLAALVAGPAPDRFVPPTQRECGRVVLPVTFTDGTLAELRYPPRLRLAQLGVEPYTSAVLGDRVARDFLIRRGGVAAVMDDLRGTLLRSYPSGASLWDTPPGDDHRLYIAFQFGRWTVLVYDYPARFGSASMTDEERAAWARSLTGRETRRGFLRLTARGRLRLAEAGEHAGPQLSLGSPGGSRWLALFPGRCRPMPGADRLVRGKRVSWDGRFATWCASRDMRVHATGRRQFVFPLIRGLDVR